MKRAWLITLYGRDYWFITENGKLVSYEPAGKIRKPYAKKVRP